MRYVTVSSLLYSLTLIAPFVSSFLLFDRTRVEFFKNSLPLVVAIAVVMVVLFGLRDWERKRK